VHTLIVDRCLVCTLCVLDIFPLDSTGLSNVRQFIRVAGECVNPTVIVFLCVVLVL
jgi:hypothetical protein